MLKNKLQCFFVFKYLMQTSLFLVKKTNLLKTNQSIDEIKTKCSTLCIVRTKRNKKTNQVFLTGLSRIHSSQGLNKSKMSSAVREREKGSKSDNVHASKKEKVFMFL